MMEHRRAFAAAIHAIEHHAMWINVETARGTEALDERKRTGVRLAALQSRLFDQTCGNDAVNALQQRREQFVLGGKAVPPAKPLWGS